MIKLGIIGAGRLGSFHADKAAAHPDVMLSAIMDSSENARKTLAEKHGAIQCATLDELMSHVDAIVIAAPTSLHFEIGEPCLRRGKHLLMEKPMCASWSEAQKLIETANRANVIFQVGHVEEFNPAWVSAQQFLSDAKHGKPVLIDAVRTSGYTFRSTDIGAVFDIMIHDIDLVLSLIPSRVMSVDAVGFNVIGGAHEDIAEARIRFENGSVANLFASRVEHKVERHTRITMQGGVLNVDFGTRTAEMIRPHEEVKEGKFAPGNMSADSTSQIAKTFMQDFFVSETIENEVVDALAKEMDDFIRAIQTGKAPKVSGKRALAAIALAEMIVQSIHKESPMQFGHQSKLRAA